MAVKAEKCGLHHAVTVYTQRACYQQSADMNMLSMQIAWPHSPLLICLLSADDQRLLMVVSEGLQSAPIQTDLFSLSLL